MVDITGKVLGGRYEIIEKIGEGGMALVYKARCRLLNRYVAVKILRDELTNDEEFIKKFRHESQAAASLSHPNIVSIYDVGVENDIHYIVMEYIKGKTLKDIIDEKGKLSPEETIDYTIQIAEALGHAHKNHIIHRDIKPHNIMVTDDKRIKVTDFGIARAATSATMTNTSSVIGSVHYFSPEQARGKFTDEKSDIYSLGIVMYEMITGKIPFEGESPISVALKHVEEEITPPSYIDSSVPKNIEHIIMKSARKDQMGRYKNTEELLKDLRKVKYSGGDVELTDNTSNFDSQTIILPAVESNKKEKKKGLNENEKKKKPEKKKDKKGSKKAVFLGILLAFLLVNGIAFGFLKFKESFMPGEVEVPDLVGVQEEIAKEKIEEMGLKFIVKDRSYSSDFKEGEIMWQNEEAGKVVKKGFPIEVTVSKGKKKVKVPKLTGKDLGEVEFVLDDLVLKEGNIDYRYSDSIPKNIIISQSPQPDTEVEEGSAIDLVISKGPEIRTSTIPNLVGLQENEAKRAIVAKGLVIGNIRYQSNDSVEKGIVLWQSYQQGTEVQENTSIDLVVSSGPEKPKKEDKKEPKEENKKGQKKDDNNNGKGNAGNGKPDFGEEEPDEGNGSGEEEGSEENNLQRE